MTKPLEEITLAFSRENPKQIMPIIISTRPDVFSPNEYVLFHAGLENVPTDLGLYRKVSDKETTTTIPGYKALGEQVPEQKVPVRELKYELQK